MFINLSFLPQSKVSHVIIDKKAPAEFISNLLKLKITPILSTVNRGVHPSLSTHPDMQLFHAGGNTIICEPTVCEYYSDILSPLGFNIICGKTHLNSTYPNDIAYNIAKVGSLCLHKKKHTDSAISEYLTRNNIRIINVAQGYTKCAVCIIGENAVITSDCGIAKTLDNLNIEVLRIKADNIILEGMDYGFIGGASGLLAPNLLAFCGNIEKHIDYRQIKSFAQKHNIDLISLCSGGLIDIGSIIPIKQEVIDWNSSQ